MLNLLPIEIIIYIFKFLPGHSLRRVSVVCKLFNEIANDKRFIIDRLRMMKQTKQKYLRILRRLEDTQPGTRVNTGYIFILNQMFDKYKHWYLKKKKSLRLGAAELAVEMGSTILTKVVMRSYYHQRCFFETLDIKLKDPKFEINLVFLKYIWNFMNTPPETKNLIKKVTVERKLDSLLREIIKNDKFRPDEYISLSDIGRIASLETMKEFLVRHHDQFCSRTSNPFFHEILKRNDKELFMYTFDFFCFEKSRALPIVFPVIETLKTNDDEILDLIFRRYHSDEYIKEFVMYSTCEKFIKYSRKEIFKEIDYCKTFFPYIIEKYGEGKDKEAMEFVDKTVFVSEKHVHLFLTCISISYAKRTSELSAKVWEKYKEMVKKGLLSDKLLYWNISAWDDKW
jgi:F-box domain.